MSLRSKTYVIDCNPIPWQRAGINSQAARFFDRQKQDKIAFGLYILSQHGNSPLFEGPLLVEATFYMPIPKTGFKKGTLWHCKKADADNFLKFLFDSITNTEAVWNDDCQVSKIITSKIYDKHPRTIFTISELE